MAVLVSASRPAGVDSERYDDAVAGWNVLHRHRPAAAIRAESSADVAAAVRFAGRSGLGVAVMATGHGIGPVGPDAVLINTAALDTIRIDPETSTAVVGGGVRFAELHAATAPFGLAAVGGSSSGVGVAGFLQGGGFGWLGRRLGFAAGWLRAAEVVTADGRLLRVDDGSHPELLWALAGGAGNFGVVTELTVDLHAIDTVHAGNLWYPLERFGEVAACYAEWSVDLPDETMSALTLRAFPPLPTVPEPLRGRSLVAIRLCESGPDPRRAAGYARHIRERLGVPVADTVGPMHATGLDPLSMDPVQPIGVVQRGEAVTAMTEPMIRALADQLPRDGGLGFAILELRRLGGALSHNPRGPHPMAHTDAMYTINAIGLAASAAEAEAVRARSSALYDALRPWLTGSTYVNFLDGDSDRARVRSAFDDDDWRRLRAIKAIYDPTNVLRYNRNIPPSTPAPSTPAPSPAPHSHLPEFTPRLQGEPS